MNKKYCPNCKRDKFVNEFYKRTKRYDGLGAYCKLCELSKNKKYIADTKYHAKYYLKNRNSRISYTKKWREKNKHRKNINTFNPFYHRIFTKHHRQNGKYEFSKLLAKFEYLGYKCIYCGSNQQLTIEHKIPIKLGGTNNLANIALACWSCNKRKYLMSYKEFKNIQH